MTAALASLVILTVAGYLCLLHLVLSRALTDRVVALNSLVVVIVNGIAVWSAYTARDELLNVMVVIALLDFAGTLAAAEFITQRRSR